MGYNNVLEGGGEQNEVGDINYMFCIMFSHFIKDMRDLVGCARCNNNSCSVFRGLALCYGLTTGADEAGNLTPWPPWMK